ncbi:hypothetical protein [Streptomyces oceani]|uniref:hypothetical protein n=1 Tax=Streptomyces oceani TaxID=1075402 RepID=UPI000872B472|nr:hypothetical protein [Streptomyces oceani]
MPVQSSLAKHRRPLATAAVAAGALLAVGFLPSANATPNDAGDGTSSHTASHRMESGTASQNSAGESDSFDSTPYVLCGIGAAGLGGLLTARAQRCEFGTTGSTGTPEALS